MVPVGSVTSSEDVETEVGDEEEAAVVAAASATAVVETIGGRVVAIVTESAKVVKRAELVWAIVTLMDVATSTLVEEDFFLQTDLDEEAVEDFLHTDLELLAVPLLYGATEATDMALVT